MVLNENHLHFHESVLQICLTEKQAESIFGEVSSQGPKVFCRSRAGTAQEPCRNRAGTVQEPRRSRSHPILNPEKTGGARGAGRSAKSNGVA